MLTLSSLVGQTKHFLKVNSPVILTGMAVSGTVTTAYLGAKAGMAHSRRLSEGPPREHLSFREEFESVWDLYIPPFVAGVATIGFIVGAAHVSSKRAAAAASVLAVSEKAFEEYRDKVVEKLGENKEQAVRDELAQERVNANPPGQAIVVARGPVLCCELYTGRYFRSDMEALRRAENEINAKLVREMYATLNDFYYILGIPYTSESGSLGWEAGKLLDLSYSTVFGPDQEPCVTFEYNYVHPL